MSVEARPVGMSLVIISWFPPSPANGVLVNYSLRVLLETSQDVAFSQVIPVSPTQQDDLQTVSVTGLNLETSRYRILVSASTRVGTGPDSTPLFIGTEVTMATDATPPTTPPPTLSTTVEMMTDEVTTVEMTTSSQTDVESTASVTTDEVTEPETTPTATPNSTAVERDDVFYVIRVVPPVVGAFLVVGVVLIVLLCCMHKRNVSQKKKGLYQFRAAESSNYQ